MKQLPQSTSGISQSRCQFNPPNRKTFFWKSLFPEQLPLNDLGKFLHTRPLYLTGKGERGTGRGLYLLPLPENLIAIHIHPQNTQLPVGVGPGVKGVPVLTPRCNLHVSSVGRGRAADGSRLDQASPGDEAHFPRLLSKRS